MKYLNLFFKDKLSARKIFLAIILLLGLTPNQKSMAQQPYNVLLIAVDDLNDWVGFLDGNAQSITPNMNKLASQSINFKNAQCAESVCNPSRVSILTGFMPFTTKIFTNNDTMRKMPVTQNCITLPQYFIRNGYKTITYGKIFHYEDPQSWVQDGYISGGSWGKLPSVPGFTPNGIPINEVDEYFYWGSVPDSLFSNTPDVLCAKWSAERLKAVQSQPFFLASGFTRPHDPWIVPKMFYDRFPLNSIVLPIIDTNDLKDIDTNMLPSKEYIAVKKYGLHKESVQAYLAAVSYADSCIGVILDALNKSAYANNTIVVLFGDNGFPLGEKLLFEKKTLFEESAHIPLLIKVPGIPAAIINTPVSLCDIYPTLLDLCNLPVNTNNEGVSLKPLMLNPQLVSNRVALTSCLKGYKTYFNGHTIRSNNWRYSEHTTGILELYDHVNDPMEFTNLVWNIAYDSTKNYMATLMKKELYKINNTRLAISPNYIPGVIQAEKYDMGGEGVAYHDEDTINFGNYYRLKDGVDIAPCLDSAGGLQIDSIKYGEWLTYTIKQIDSGAYNLDFRVLSNSTTTK
ncbi:MAG: sulfatase-like hydrolase/transferase [Bacteroidetes bacterium]|nr:sulfatase-like hydrolase/transferase [Bacteroidota bacterium]